MNRRISLALTCLAIGATACGDDDTTTDPDASVTEDMGPDSGGGEDTEAPRVTSTRPRPMEDEVARTASVSIRFSEPVVTDSGTITVTGPDGAVSTGTPDWAETGDVVDFAPEGTWPGGAAIEVVVDGYVDEAGNAMEAPYSLVFSTSDEGSPEVSSTTPAEGATDVPTDPLTVSIVFSEPMNPLLGSLELIGEGALGTPAWSSETELRVEVTGLRPSSNVRIALDGFEDRSANVLDPEPVLGNGALDFTTAADTTAPTVVDSAPSHEQLDVAVGRLNDIVVQFSEPMDTSIRTVSYEAGTTVGILNGNWNADGTTITFDARGRIEVDTEHRLDLSSMRDSSRNLLDGSVGLDAGELVFTTSAADAVIPFVVFTTPAEGATGVSTRSAELRVLFSEEMDFEQTMVTLTAPSGDLMLEGSWNLATTELTVPLSGLAANETYAVDLTAFADVSGNPIDDTHPYLADGVLEFTTGEPSGESCRDPLDSTVATTDGSVQVWNLDERQFTSSEGNPSCASGSVLDGVVRYEKTTADIAGGGTALHLTAIANDPYGEVFLEVYQDICDAEAVGGGGAAREACLGARLRWDQYLDVPAGNYFIWVATDSAESCGSFCERNYFSGVELRVEEVSTIPEGESCADPYDTGSSIHSSMGTDAHRWVVPGYSKTSHDYGPSASGEGGFMCDSFAEVGPDTVIEIPKARAGSILDVTIDMYPGDSSFGSDDAVAAITNLCEVGDEGGRELACDRTISSTSLERFQVAGDIGSYYLWIAADNPDEELLRATVDVVEVDPQPGESCSSAIDLTVGANAITPSATTNYFQPSCIDVDTTDPDEYQAVTWYKFTTTEELAVFELEGTADAPMALIDAASSTESVCIDEAVGLGLPQRVGAGTEVCIAVPSTTDITGIQITELPWQGVDGGTITDMGILRPFEPDGDEESITGEAWLEVTPTQLYMGISVTSSLNAAIVSAPRSGGVRASLIPADVYSIGNGAASIGEALWSIDESDSSARPERLHRLIDSAGTVGTTPWDTGSSYILADIDTLTKVVGEDAFLAISDNETGQEPTVYRIPSDTPGAATALAEILVDGASAIAATPEWLFVGGTGPDGNSFYRISRADLTGTPELLAPVDLVSTGSSNGSMVYDETTDILYFRSYRSPYGIYAIFGAASATPTFAGQVALIGRSSDYGLAIDKATQTLFAFESEVVSTGSFLEIQ